MTPNIDMDEKERIRLLKLEIQTTRSALTNLIRKEFNKLEEIADGKIRSKD